MASENGYTCVCLNEYAVKYCGLGPQASNFFLDTSTMPNPEEMYDSGGNTPIREQEYHEEAEVIHEASEAALTERRQRKVQSTQSGQ